LAIGVGARGLGMSGSQIASVEDVTSGYWNPAGLLGVKSDLQVGAMHSEYFAGIAKYDFVGFAKAIDEEQAIGLSFIRFGVDDIPNTTELIDAKRPTMRSSSPMPARSMSAFQWEVMPRSSTEW
jgi:hypothetical protein